MNKLKESLLKLTTNNKENLVSAINEVNEEYKRAIDDIQIGGRNYFRRSLIKQLGWTTEGLITMLSVAKGFYLKVKEGDVYSVSRKEIINNRFSIHFSKEEPQSGVKLFGSVHEDLSYKIENIVVPSGANFMFLYLTNKNDIIPDIKLEKGNIATDWTPAPEDREEEIELLKNEIRMIKEKMNSIQTK